MTQITNHSQHPTINQATAREIYRILMVYAGAPPQQLEHFLSCMDSNVQEYRFGGKLGFGGKLRIGDSWFVDCYPEDLDDTSATIMKATNSRLKRLYRSKMCVCQMVVKREISGVSLHCLSQWKLTLACGQVVYKVRQPWNRGNGGVVKSAPRSVYCDCQKCREEARDRS